MHNTRKILGKTGKLYGIYSHPWGIVYNQESINIRKTNLKKLPFFNKIKKNSQILEIGGTGQDAVAWQQLGFKTTFIDLSRENCRRTAHFSKNNIKVINDDFLRYKFNKKFDVIRSRGVIHHFSKPSFSLKKIYALLVLNGFFHFNLYRSGIFYYYFVEKLREISKTFNLKLFYRIIIKTKIKKEDYLKIDNRTIKSKNRFYSLILDDMFVPICNPANYFDILKDLKKLGFKIIKQNKIKKYLNHDLLYPDFPLKKEHIVFDVQKSKNKINKSLKLKYKVSKNTETKITNEIPFMKKTNNIFKKLCFLSSKHKWYKNDKFIKEFIMLYKDCCLLSVTKMSSSERHLNLQIKLKSVIKKTYLGI
jgi:SAM-dependent methyltransferase|tara:strand:- start:145 stop:1233 length:1089 start_codon:yes stop_codon:yes gene_type:complete